MKKIYSFFAPLTLNEAIEITLNKTASAPIALRESVIKNTPSRMVLRILIVMLTGLLTTQFLAAQDWYDADWLYRSPVTVPNPGATELLDFQVQVTLSTANFDFTKAKSDGSDIMVTSSNGTTLIPFWIENWNPTGSEATIWIKVPSIPVTTGTTVFIYYGNDAQTLPSSNPDAVFDFYDSFDGTSLDLTKWRFTKGNISQTSVGSGMLTMTVTSTYAKIDGRSQFGMNYIVETRAQHPDQGTLNLIAEVGFSNANFTCVRIVDDFTLGTTYWQRQAKLSGHPDIFTNMTQTADKLWHTFRVFRQSPNIAGYQIDNNPIETTNTNVPTESLPPFLMSYAAGGTNHFVVDWTRVRKWAGSDPATVVGAEESYGISWTGQVGTDWHEAGNWSGETVPDANTNVNIPEYATNMPVISGETTASCSILRINSGASLTVNAGQALTVGGTLSNSGTLNLYSSEAGIASLKVGSYTDNGTENIQLYLTGDDAGTGWHYISPPVSSVLPSLFTANASTAVAEYQESLISTDMDNGWVTSLGYHYNTMIPTPAWQSGSSWIYNYLVAGRGYYYYSASTTTTPFNIQGSINTGDVPVSLSYNSGGFDDGNRTPAQQGFNLIGNPFTCGIDWDLVVSNNSIWSDVEAAIYFRSNGVIYTYNGTTTVPGDLGNGDEIPPMQGFFIKANAGATLTIPAVAKIHTGHVTYKGSSSVPLVRLQIENSGKTDETVIGFNDKATMSFDNLFDARKIFAPSDAPYIYSSLEGTKYTINAIPFPESSISIPLVINASTDGSYTITATQIEGLENYKVYLLDKSQNFTSDLSSSKSYSFNSLTGLFTDRFVLTVTNILTGISESIISDKPFNIYSSGEMINIQTLSDDWNSRIGEIRVLDLAGKLISVQGDIVFSKDEIRQLPVKVRSGIYFVQINSDQRRYVGRVMIK
jgi:hypothetical protein